MNLRQSTAVTLIVGPILDSTGAAKTDEVVANIRLSKNGTVAAPNASATLTHDHAGKYKLVLTTSDTDTLGCLQVSLTSGTNDMAVHDFNVATQAAWDALYAASGGYLPAKDHGGNNLAVASTALSNATWTDAKAGYIDQAISTKRAATLAAADVSGNLPADVKAWNGGALPVPAVAGDAMALTSGERTTLAAAIEAAIINELDGQAVMQAIADLIASDMTTTDLTVAAIASAVRDAILNRVLAGNHDTSGTAGKLLQNADVATSTRGTGTSTLDAAGVRSAIGMASANLDTQLAGLAGSTGSGAYTITVTVTDGTNPLESAKVRFTKGAESYLGTTNASGVATFALDSGTWAVAITLPLYTFTTTTKVVSATGAQTYAMTATSFPASAANQVTGYVYCYGSDGQPEAGVVVTLRQVDYPTATGGGYDTTARTATTDANGLAAFTGCWPGATYTIKGSGQARTYKIPASATGTVALASFMGVA